MPRSVEDTKKATLEPENIADEVAERVIQILGKTSPVRKIRNSHLLSALIGAAGLALFFVGIEKVFAALTGWTSIVIGLILLSVSGALLTKLK